ncbi:MAG: 1-deoxy-D-xylulose-5-phosphate reductoisomerase [Chloroflexota bacterium]
MRVVVLGSTGSIGRQTLEVLAAHRDRFELVAIASAHASAAFDAQRAAHPAARAWSADTAQAHGTVADGLVELATGTDADLVVVATTGMAALPAVLAALRAGRRVALANKETLVAGGHLVAAALDERGGDPLDWLRPIDSEHSAIWQCLVGEPAGSVARLVLTASGGPFRGRASDTLGDVTPNEALAHPTWRMGPKITVDSATLVNKAFEVIEARWLYQLPYATIDAVIHPQSVVHSFVEFVDGSYKAQLGLPDMRLPIQYALTHPDRLPAPSSHGTPEAWASLTFERLAPGAYPAYDTVRAAVAAGGNHGTVVNAADEVAVAAFLDGRLPFTGIAGSIAAAAARWGSADEPDLDTIVALDHEIRATLDAELAGRP